MATFLPPDMNWLDDYEALRTAGKLPEGSDLMGLLDRRLAWEIWSEYTFDCRIGRTLEKTGSSTLEVKPDIWQRVSSSCCRVYRSKLVRCASWTKRPSVAFLRACAEPEEPRRRGRRRLGAVYREPG